MPGLARRAEAVCGASGQPCPCKVPFAEGGWPDTSGGRGIQDLTSHQQSGRGLGTGTWKGGHIWSILRSFTTLAVCQTPVGLGSAWSLLGTETHLATGEEWNGGRQLCVGATQTPPLGHRERRQGAASRETAALLLVAPMDDVTRREILGEVLLPKLWCGCCL